MKHNFFLFITAILTLFNCTKPNIPIESQLLQKCIDAHGGSANWNAVPNIHYKKNIMLYNELGVIEKDLSQVHQYNYLPNLTGTIEWEDSIKRKITYQNGQAFKTNGDLNQAPDSSSLNTFNSAFYVLNMPWKLEDKSANVSYHGLDTILGDRIVHSLKVVYPSESQNDIWHYYLDQKEYYLVANLVHHGSTYSLITNDEFVWHKDLKWNSKRTSYMTDSLGNVLYLRAKYEYVYMD